MTNHVEYTLYRAGRRNRGRKWKKGQEMVGIAQAAIHQVRKQWKW